MSRSSPKGIQYVLPVEGDADNPVAAPSGGAAQSNTIRTGTTTTDVKFAPINLSASGQSTVVAAVAGKRIRVLGYFLNVAGAVTLTWRSAANAISGPMPFAANGGQVVPTSQFGYLQTNVGEALTMNLSAAIAVGGVLAYAEV